MSEDEFPRRFEPTPEGYLHHLEHTRKGYLERDLERYLRGYSEEFRGIDTSRPELSESINALERKMRSDLQNWDLLKMELESSTVEVADNIGHALLEYESVLRKDDDYLLDRRKNILIGRHDGERWWIVFKTTIYQDTNPVDQQAAELLLDQ